MIHSIRTKILILQIGLMLCAIVALGASTYFVMSQSLESSQQQNLEYLVQEVGKNIHAIIDARKDLLERIATSDDVSGYAATQQDMFLIRQFSKHAAKLPVLSYANVNGVERLKLVSGQVTQDLRSISDTSIFVEAARYPNRVAYVYLPSDNEYGGPCLALGYYGMSASDEFTGFFRGLVPVSDIAGSLRKMRIGKTGFILLVDSDGRVLSFPEHHFVADRVVIEQNGRETGACEMLRSMEAGYGQGRVMGIDSYFVFAPIREIDWSVMAVVPREEFVGELSTLRNTVVLIGAVVLIAGGLVMLAVADNIARPILTLTKGTALVAQGDFSRRIEVASRDEIGMLAESFNRMSEDLQRTTTSISKLNLEMAERRRAEDALVKINKELEAAVSKLTNANRELEEFSHLAAHDLKTPLRAIGSLAGIIHTDYWEMLDEQGRNYLSLLTGRVERMNHFIRGILRYSELGRALEKQTVDIDEVIDEALGRISLPASCIVIKESNFPAVVCNRAQMVEVFSQLIGNAVKYMDKPAGRIKLACEKGDGLWKFSVADNGCGIDERHLGRIFEIFRTLNRRDEIESTGIGLSLVRKIIETYDGKVWVESRPGEGSTFWFTLPIQKTGVIYEKLSANTAG
ncbi:MAG TPA: ATP-binding protein [Sedimentisphaerales bacterium]|nr:ATP-binding protein [Sedimentisphaerales bacterium]